MDLRRESKIRPYIVAVFAVACAAVLTEQLPALLYIHNMSLFMLSVVGIAWYGGFGPSLLAIVLSAACFAYFIAPPRGFAIGSHEDWIRLSTFVILNLVVSALISALTSTRGKVQSLVQRLSLTLEATKLGLWDLNLKTGFIWHSTSLEKIYDRRSDRFAHSYEVFLGYVHPEDRDFVHRIVTRTIENGEEYHIQHRIVLPDGEIRWVSTRGRAILNSKGQAEHIMAVTADMTNRPGATLPPGASSSEDVAPPGAANVVHVGVVAQRV